MKEKRILSVQDISCIGQCSLTVSLPILSAFGFECAILPTSLLSSHTAFRHVSLVHLEEELPNILAAWEKEGVLFDAVCTGYIGSIPSVNLLHHIFSSFLVPNAPIFVDPVMGDNGVLYRHFDKNYVDAVRKLLPPADIILPNFTEACLLTNTPYEERCDEDFIAHLHNRLHNMGATATVITGLPLSEEKIGISIKDGANATATVYQTERIKRASHGSGDVFASCLIGHYLRGKSLTDAAKCAADFTCNALKSTHAEHWYGLSFEPLLPQLF